MAKVTTEREPPSASSWCVNRSRNGWRKESSLFRRRGGGTRAFCHAGRWRPCGHAGAARGVLESATRRGRCARPVADAPLQVSRWHSPSCAGSSSSPWRSRVCARTCAPPWPTTPRRAPAWRWCSPTRACALWGHRIAHQLWRDDFKLAARVVSHANRFVTGVEIHPGARIGHKVFIDHGMGVVIGETASVGDGTLIYKGVVLGGVSLDHCVRHPQVGSNVVIGSNACILGSITIGDGARIGSGSVVVKAVPPGATVVGVPGRLVTMSTDRRTRFAESLDHANLPDPVTDMIRALAAQNDRLRHRIEMLEEKLEVPSPDSELHDDDPFATGGAPYPKLEGG
ncbi:MAG: serine O-acetyltransferase EpsC [Polyangiaceae bacterium]